MVGKQSILACLLLGVEYQAVTKFERNCILREQILETVI